MTKNAFTLIELLAVIVILAIIALIAVPIIVHIINNTKTSSGEEAVKLYIDSVKKAISRKQLEDTSFNPTECTIKDNGNLLCNDIEVTIDMRGIKPNKGIIEIKDNKVTYKNLLLNGTYYNRLATLVQDNNNNGKPDIGDKYTYKVNDTDTFNFYVLSFNEDDTVNLIMDRNICEDGTVEYKSSNNYCRTYWYSERNNNYGPVTAMQKLHNGTKKWKNVPNMNLNYIDENNNKSQTDGYIGVTISNGIATIIGKNGASNTIMGTNEFPIKSRLPKEIEERDNECTRIEGTCPARLVENLTYWDGENSKYLINNNMESYQHKLIGYWILSTNPGGSASAMLVRFSGNVDNYTTLYENSGVRPVITVPKSYLES